MLKNYFKFALRVFSRDKFYTLLNLLGLAVGISCGIIIMLFLKHELSYDNQHLKQAQIYRLGSHFTTEEIDARLAISSSMLAPLLKDEYPSIEAFVRFRSNGKTFFQYDGTGQNQNQLYEENIWFADSAIFNVFTHEFIAGNPVNCLTEINSIVLSEQLAVKYFGEEAVKNGSALGEILSVDNTYTCKLTGIIKDVPSNQHLRFDGLISYHTQFQGEPIPQDQIKELLWNTPDYSYLLFVDAGKAEQFLSHFPPFFDKYMGEFGANFGANFVPILEPLTEIHFNSTLADDLQRGNSLYLYAFGLVGMLLLLLACINYMNLATARSTKRAKEIGLRKVMGAGKSLLVARFIGESILLTFFALLVALIMVATTLKFLPIDTWMGSPLKLNLLEDPILLLQSLALSLIIGVISSVYPAFYLASVEPIKVLKGVFVKSSEGRILRKILVGAQFVISIAVVISTLLMREQIEFMRTSDLGFDKENMVIIPTQDNTIRDQLESLKNELLGIPGVKHVTFGQEVPGNMTNSQVYHVESINGDIEKQLFAFNYIGYDYIESMGLKLIEGRNFDRAMTTDVSDAYIVNQSFVRKMGWEHALGKKLSNDFADDGSPQGLGQIIGVIEDFHTVSLHNPVDPLILRLQRRPSGYLHVKVSSPQIKNVLNKMEDKWQALGSVYPFEYSFLNEDFDKMYKSDERQSNLLNALAWICIFISCMGLFGLTSFSITQRTKEIAIRKVLGASIPQIVQLLFKNILILILFAVFIASPLAWNGINYWLEGFAYRIDIQPLLFITTAVGAVLLAFVSVGSHIYKVAQSNPIEALYHE